MQHANVTGHVQQGVGILRFHPVLPQLNVHHTTIIAGLGTVYVDKTVGLTDRFFNSDQIRAV